MAKLIIIGSGIVGRATGGGFIAGGHEVVFCDINLEVLAKLQNQGHKVCSPNLLEQETNVKAFFLAISTPTVDNKIKLDFLESAVASLGEGALKKCNDYCIVVIRSTVPPNTIESTLIPLLEKYSGKKAGKDFGVCMNPEYLREETALDDARKPWLILIGEYDKKSGDVLASVCQGFTCPVVRCQLIEAEMQKYVHNLFNAAKITFFNEIRQIGKQIGIDTKKLFQVTAASAEGMWNPQYGIKDLGPFQGSCLPKDTLAFLAWAQENGLKAQFVATVVKVNDALLKTNGERKPTQIGVYL